MEGGGPRFLAMVSGHVATSASKIVPDTNRHPKMYNNISCMNGRMK